MDSTGSLRSQEMSLRGAGDSDAYVLSQTSFTSDVNITVKGQEGQPNLINPGAVEIEFWGPGLPCTATALHSSARTLTH